MSAGESGAANGRDPASGRFGAGVSGNPRGRPRKAPGVGQAILGALNETVQVTEQGKRRRVTKGVAIAKQMINKGASGDLRAIKLGLDLAQKAEDKLAAVPAAPAELTASDIEIVVRIKERLRLILAQENAHEEDADVAADAA